MNSSYEMLGGINYTVEVSWDYDRINKVERYII